MSALKAPGLPTRGFTIDHDYEYEYEYEYGYGYEYVRHPTSDVRRPTSPSPRSAILPAMADDTTIISDEQVRHVAKLSRLKLTGEQVHTYAVQLSHVLSYIEKLNELDVEGVEPMAHPNDLVNRFREDVPGEALPVDAALLNAPAADRPFFKVPKVLGDASSS